jgi:ABC-type multidrug transport system fused ATPase/permease subunit
MARGRLNSGSKAEIELPKAKINKQSLRNVIRLLSYLKPYRAKFIVALFFLFISSLTGLAFPAILGALIDAAQGIYKYKFLPRSINAIGLFGFALLFGQAFISFFRVVFFVQVAEKSLADIRRDTYFKLITLPKSRTH